MVKGRVRKALGALFRALAGSEALDELPAPPVDRDPSFLAWLLRRERLPVDEPGAEQPRTTLLRLVFSSEHLPRDEGPRAGGAGSGHAGAGRAA